MKKQRQFPPDEGLKEPVMKFEDTFSAETIILETFFKKVVDKNDKIV